VYLCHSSSRFTNPVQLCIAGGETRPLPMTESRHLLQRFDRLIVTARCIQYQTEVAPVPVRVVWIEAHRLAKAVDAFLGAAKESQQRSQ